MWIDRYSLDKQEHITTKNNNKTNNNDDDDDEMSAVQNFSRLIFDIL